MFARKKIIVMLVAVLVFSGGAVWAAPTTSKQAGNVVKGLLKAVPQPLGMKLGKDILEVETFSDSKGQPVYYVVYLAPSGFVIVPADDMVEPIIAFASGGRYDPSDDNCLGALVSRDVPWRVATARAVEAATAGKPLEERIEKQRTAIEKASAKARSRWSRLRGYVNKVRRNGNRGAVGDGGGSGEGLEIVSDVWVAPLVQSKWSQANLWCGQMLSCFNYYTPPYEAGNPDNYVCGCGATALAQLLRYHEHPTDGIGVRTFEITVDGVPQDANTRGGDGEGGPYNWSEMVLDPNCSITEAQRQAIGALCYDAGVSMNTAYSAYGSATGALVHWALRFVFNYSNAIQGMTMFSYSLLPRVINTNLDAGYPCPLHIIPPGHAVVADGYGYNGETLYHHLNMGWGGQYDLWYNLPNVLRFDCVYTVFYNIFTSGTGEIISGRVTDECGREISGVTVTAQGTGGPYTDQTDDNGIYACAKVASTSTYTVSAAKDGYSFTSRNVSVGKSQDGTSLKWAGNRWGIDFVGEPTVIVVTPCDEFETVRLGEMDLFKPQCITYTLTNAEHKAHHWTASNTESWLNIEPDGGTLAPDGSADVNVCVNSSADDLPDGTYYDTITFTDTSTGLTFQRDVKLMCVNESLVCNLDTGTEYMSVQEAIDDANDGEELVVHPATYYETINFGGKAITLRSTDPNDWYVVAATVIDGNGAEHVVEFSSSEDADSILKGFTITGGDANGSWPDNCGGGVFCWSVTSMTISNCVIRDNRATYLGGGMWNYNGSNPTVTNCFFINNEGGDGGGMCNYAESGTEGSNPTLTNCVFRGNYSGKDGGGVYNMRSYPNIINCTFSKNDAESAGGGMYTSSGNPTVTNCIFWDNTAYPHLHVQAWQIAGDSMVVNYNCIKAWTGNLGGTGNFGHNPEFVAPTKPAGFDSILGTTDDGLELSSTSPCIDAGDNSVVSGITKDITGVTNRSIDGDGEGTPPEVVDMGAYEYDPNS